jgi:hypothetical protein
MTNNDAVAVPWGEVASNPEKYLDPTYQPGLVKIKEPSKMSAMHIRALYKFWVKRQDRKLPVFRFKTVVPSHVHILWGKKKRDLDWEGMSWVMESDGETFNLSDAEEKAPKGGKKWKGKAR